MKQRLLSFLKCYLFFVVLFVVQSGITYLFIRHSSLQETEVTLSQLTQRVKHDLRFTEGKWDTSLYNSDPFTAYPNSSSANPLYIVTTDGFVIERSKPINGILDTSDFKHLMQFQTPQLITTVTNEHWRMLSKPIIRDNKTYGVILVALYNPEENLLDKVDQQLKENIEKIDTEIVLENDRLNVEKVDVRNIQYLVSFEIVDTFNKVLINDGRVPTFIDPSYVAKELKARSPRVVTDTTTQQSFLTFSEKITETDGHPVAVLVAGRSIQPLENVLKEYVLAAILLCAFLPVPLSLFVLFLSERYVKTAVARLQSAANERKLPKHISFDKKASVIMVDDEKVEIVYASNQYYLAKAIFTSPKKRWEQDELLDLIGETHSADKQRSIYDAALALNKKTRLKLVSYQDKTYFLNPDLRASL